MLQWNTTISRGIDVLFGVLPALYFAFWAVLGCYIMVTAPNIEQNLNALVIFALCLGGLTACISLIYVSITREITRSKTLHMVLLALGVLVAIILFVFPSPLSFIGGLNTVFPFLALSLVLVATKHIYLLARVEQKVSL